MDVLIAIIGGGVGAAVVTVVGQIIIAKQARRFQQEDRRVDDMAALKEGISWLLYDRILYLSRKYIDRGWLSLEDLKVIKEQHRIYHDRLGGNGYLDKVMAAVEALPLHE